MNIALEKVVEGAILPLSPLITPWRVWLVISVLIISVSDITGLIDGTIFTLSVKDATNGLIVAITTLPIWKFTLLLVYSLLGVPFGTSIVIRAIIKNLHLKVADSLIDALNANFGPGSPDTDTSDIAEFERRRFSGTKSIIRSIGITELSVGVTIYGSIHFEISTAGIFLLLLAGAAGMFLVSRNILLTHLSDIAPTLIINRNIHQAAND